MAPKGRKRDAPPTSIGEEEQKRVDWNTNTLTTLVQLVHSERAYIPTEVTKEYKFREVHRIMFAENSPHWRFFKHFEVVEPSTIKRRWERVVSDVKKKHYGENSNLSGRMQYVISEEMDKLVRNMIREAMQSIK